MVNTFAPQCSLPSETVNFVSSPNVRGTLDILWPCLSIIFLCTCTWSVQHISVPPQLTPRNKTQWLRRAIYFATRKAISMICTLLAPEWTLVIAIMNLREARLQTKDMKSRADEDGVPWTLSHSFLANMGGIMVHFPHGLGSSVSEAVPLVQVSTASQESSVGELREDSLGDRWRTDDVGGPATALGIESTASPKKLISDHAVLGFESNMCREGSQWSKYGEGNWKVHPANKRVAKGGSGIVEKKYRDSHPDYWKLLCDLLTLCEGDHWVLNTDQVALARRFGILDLPNLTEDDINDKNKGDIIVKGLAVLQILWLILQLIIRKSRSLPTSQLEVITLAFAACTSITYAILWNHPQDVNTPVCITAKRVPNPAELAKIAEKTSETGSTFGGHYVWLPRYIKFSSRNRGSSYILWSRGSTCNSSLVFGSIHLLAWNLDFPSPVERELWRIGAILTIFLPIVGIVVQYFNHPYEGLLGKIVEVVSTLMSVPLLLSCGHQIVYYGGSISGAFLSPSRRLQCYLDE